MVPFCLVLVCGFFMLTLSVNRNVFAESNENWDENHDWKSAIRKIKELEKLVKVQDERISTLEKRPTESECKSIVELQKTVQKQNDRIGQLEKWISELVAKTEDESVQEESHGDVFNVKENTVSSKQIRKARLLLQPTAVPVESVAFYAYFSTHTPAATDHHILAFDTVITNVGNAYHPHSGTFIAPRSGIYVFTWTIRVWGNSKHTTELLVDNKVLNTIYFDPHNEIDGSATGTAVVFVNQGDDVLVRTGTTYNTGDVKSDTNGRSSFAGWILL